MKNLVHLLFEAKMLKEIPRSGYHFLGAGKESIAEHSFLTTFIAFVMAKMNPEADPLKLISMCLVHDLPEARTGDLNYVQKQYVSADEAKALELSMQNLPFGEDIKALVREFNQGETIESKLSHDADQISLIIELKALADTGCKTPDTWFPNIIKRLKTEFGQKLTGKILETGFDEWWRNNYIDNISGKP